MTDRILTSNFSVTTLNDLRNSLEKDNLYFFASRVSQYSIDENTPDNIVNDNIFSSVHDELIFGKRITPERFSFVKEKRIWTQGDVYDSYTSQEAKDFYTFVPFANGYRLYICLDNNSSSPSTSVPSGNALEPFTTADYYTWKYMCVISESDILEFGTQTYLPIKGDPDVQAAANGGEFASIIIDSQGSGYINHFAGELTSSDIMVNGDPVKYRLGSSASAFNGTYEGCLIIIKTGPAAGEYRRIVSYSNNILTLTSGFSVTPAAGDVFEILPRIVLDTDDYEIESVAVARIENNSVKRIEFLNRGRGYGIGHAYVYANPSLSVIPAELRCVITSAEGLGANIAKDLFANKICLSTLFNDDENGYFQKERYKTIGIIRNPIFQNISLSSSKMYSSPLAGENFSLSRKLKTSGTAAANNTAILVGNNTSWTDLRPSDKVFLTDGVNHKLTTVNSVVNSTSIVLSSNVGWSNTNVSLYSIPSSGLTGIVKSAQSNTIVIDTALSLDTKYDFLTSSTGAADIDYASNTSLTIEGRQIDFNYFDQLVHYTGVFANGFFDENEKISSNTASAVFYSGSTSEESGDKISVLKTRGSFSDSDVIVGENDAKEFIVSNKYDGMLKRNSGEILYVQNILPVDRKSNSQERFKLLIEI